MLNPALAETLVRERQHELLATATRVRATRDLRTARVRAWRRAGRWFAPASFWRLLTARTPAAVPGGLSGAPLRSRSG